MILNETCGQCGFDGVALSDQEAIEAIAGLLNRFIEAVAGLSTARIQTRPIDGMWSIAEYVNHVREVLFGIRFILDIALNSPGLDLGDASESRFEPEPRLIVIEEACFNSDRKPIGWLINSGWCRLTNGAAG